MKTKDFNDMTREELIQLLENCKGVENLKPLYTLTDDNLRFFAQKLAMPSCADAWDSFKVGKR